ncbi:hypothetical protein QQ045_000929 [Rhodiola kirilowii]
MALSMALQRKDQDILNAMSMLMRLMKFYPDDFNFGDQNLMEHQLRLYIDNVREDERFSNLKDLCALARVMVWIRESIEHILWSFNS